jgi:hypothetical protein
MAGFVGVGVGVAIAVRDEALAVGVELPDGVAEFVALTVDEGLTVADGL